MKRTSFLTLITMLLVGGANAQQTDPIKVPLTLDQSAINMDFLIKNYQPYTPTMVALSETRPAAIVKEPAYEGKPLYGAFVLGNGPHCVTYFAVDEAEGKVGHIYFDKKQDGDLTESNGAWDKADQHDGIYNYETTVTLHASWGSPIREDEAGDYSLFVYKQHGASRLGYVKTTARTGSVTLGGKAYHIMVAENTSDAIFTVPKPTDRTRRAVQLYIDVDGDGFYRGAKTTVNNKEAMVGEIYDLSKPIQIGGSWYDVSPSISGSEVWFNPTSAPNTAGTQPQGVPEEVVHLIANGKPAPDFTAVTPTGGSLKLSAYRGKYVLLDFWATWCGPCQVSMPGLEKIYGKVKSQKVVVLSINVFDEKSPFQAWIKKNQGTKYTFTFGFDPAGHDDKKSIAASKYGVSGIPTLFLIDPKGKIVQSFIGSGNEEAIKTALKKLGIKI